MRSTRWWDISVAVTVLAMAILAAVSQVPPARLPFVLGSLAAFALAYACVGRRLLAHAESPPMRPRSNLAFIAALTVIAAVGVSAEPNLATLQVILFPMVWMLAPGYASAVALSAGVATLLGVGMWAGLSPLSEHALVTAVASQCLSFAFAVGIGSWLSHAYREGAEARSLVAKLTASRDEVARLSERAGAAAERERLSRELHDTLTQSLTGLVMLAERAGHQEAGHQEASGSGAAHPDELAATLSLVERAARQALAEARSLVAEHHPIGDRGLTASLRRIAAQTAEETGLEVSVDVTGHELPRDDQVVVLRCAQEALANVRKHAGATRVSVRLAGSGGGTLFTVLDDGVGPADAPAAPPAATAAASRGGFGLPGLRERVTLVGGELQFGPAPGGGSLLRVRLPPRGEAT